MKQYKIPKEPKYSITAFTKGGEEFVRLKINPNKRHSGNNTIIGWNIYRDGVLDKILYKQIKN